ncbi:MAG: prepilin peptidase [Alphaproteobacteria bacterium]
MLIHSASIFGLIVLLATAAITDFREFRIPNVVSFGVLLLFPLHVATSAVPVAYVSALLVAGIVFAVGAAFFAAGVMGGGDVKLLAGVALWAGPAQLVPLLYITILGSIVVAIVVALRAAWSQSALAPAGGEAPASTVPADKEPVHAVRRAMGAIAALRYVPLMKLTIPYGVAVAAGGIYVALQLLQS